MALTWTPVTQQNPPAFTNLILAVRKPRIGGADMYVDLGYYDTNLTQWRAIHHMGTIRGEVTHYIPLPPIPDDAQYQLTLSDFVEA